MSLLRTLVLTAFPLFLVGLLFLELVGPIAPATLRAARAARTPLVQRAMPVAPLQVANMVAASGGSNPAIAPSQATAQLL